jgi:hypothetical protein
VNQAAKNSANSSVFAVLAGFLARARVRVSADPAARDHLLMHPSARYASLLDTRHAGRGLLPTPKKVPNPKI